MKKIILFFVLLIFSLQLATAQTYLSVPLSDPVYVLLDNAEERGLLPALPVSKPYSKAKVKEFLYELEANSDKLSFYERKVLSYHLQEFETEHEGIKKGRYASEGSFGDFAIGMKFASDYRVNFNNPESWHMYNGIIAYLHGDIGNYFSYYGHAGGSIDKIAPDYFYKHITMEASEKMDPLPSPYYIEGTAVQAYEGEMHDYDPPGAFAPYQFTAIWDGHHSNPLTAGLNDGVMPEPSVALTTRDEITASFYDGDLTLRFGRLRREWGYGDGSLTLSGSARPFEGFETHLSPTDWFEYSWVVGSLGSWFVDSYIDKDVMEDLSDGSLDDHELYEAPMTGYYFSEQKMLTLQQFILKPADWLSLMVSSSAIWGKRFEMTYLSPMLLPFMAQEFNGDFDNVNMTFGFSMRFPWLGKLYGTFFLDETSGSSIEELFTYARNMYAYQYGTQTPIPGLPFTTLTLQYTKINPFVYSHYFEEKYADFSVPVSMTYTNDGENLGYYLPPNSDEILVKVESFPRPNLLTTLSYKLIRHGTNDYDPDNPTAQIYGDIYIPFDYSQHSAYPLKDFLKDGVYDWSNIVSIKGEYAFPGYPFAVGLEYIFSHTFWDTNGRAVSTPGSITQNIVSFSFSLFQ